MFWQVSERVRSRTFLGALGVVAVLILLWSARKWSEPRYERRTVRSWIEQLPHDTASNSEAQQAMRYFDTRAVPYLVDAVVRPQKWGSGLLSKIPRRFVNRVIDLSQQQQVCAAAMWRLQELAREEIERNELEASPRYPVLDQIIPLWKRELREDPTGRIVGRLGMDLGPVITNVAAEAATAFQRLNPTQWEWSQAANILAETHDPKLVLIFMSYTVALNPDETREAALHALIRNGHASGEVENAFRDALASTNDRLKSMAILGGASLNICRNEALAAIRAKRDDPSRVGPHEARVLDFAEPMLRWRLNTKDATAVNWIERNLSAEAKPYIRMQTADLLGKAGPAARQFVPALERMAREQGAPFVIPAVRALRAIDPDEARRIVATLPRPTLLHPRAAGQLTN